MKRKNFLILFLIAASGIVLTGSPAMAEQFTVLGKPLNLFGYATQEVAIGLKNTYDTENGVNSALMNLFVEGDYSPLNNLKLYAAGMLTVDWAYQLNSNRDSWSDKLFSKSSDNLNVDGKYWQVLKEAHATWTPGDFMFRVGKQTVAWGETDGFRLMDQINPLDQRRGFADVEFETTIIPIWLLRAEYNLPIKPSWIQNLNLEFVYNPNADFIPNQGILAGNADGGIWAPNAPISFPFPPFRGHLATAYGPIDTPSRWKEGNEFAFRIKGVVKDAIVTLNAFYGRDNDPVTKLIPPFTAPVPPHIFASDGALLLHPFQEGKYPLFRFVGATFSRDITPLKASSLGGVAPVLRLETFYAFNNTFTFSNPLSGGVIQRFEKSDEFRGSIGADWKVRIPFLNPNTYFFISPQFFYRRIMDYPSFEEIQGLKKNNYQTTLMINTSYFHNKLTPSFFWMHDINSKSDMFRLQLVYDYSNKWHFTLGGLLLNGSKRGEGFQLFENKNYIYFKIAYKWG
jgi:hypothetical protein